MKRIEITLTLEVPQDMAPATVYHDIIELALELDIETYGWKIISGSAKEKDS